MRPIPILAMVMTFRERLAATIRAARPVLEEPGVLVVGSEVPNLLEPGAAATLVVSKDLDVGVPVDRHAAVKRRLDELVGLRPSKEEPSVWLPGTLFFSVTRMMFGIRKKLRGFSRFLMSART